jgi:polyhydroxyalkanoate synthesis regulator phasin
MVILAAAAITAAGVGAYQGGKAVVSDVGKKIRRSTTQRQRNQERKMQTNEMEQQRQQEEALKQRMSVQDRVQKFKQNIPDPNNKSKTGLFGKSSSK